MTTPIESAAAFAAKHRSNDVTGDRPLTPAWTRVKCDGDCDFYTEADRWHDAMKDHDAHVAEELVLWLAAQTSMASAEPLPRAGDDLVLADALAEATLKVTDGSMRFDDAQAREVSRILLWGEEFTAPVARLLPAARP